MLKGFIIIFSICLAVKLNAQDDVAPEITPDMVKDCESMGYCEDVSNYPTALIDKLLQEAQNPVPIITPSDPLGPNIYDSKYTQICDAVKQRIAPRAAMMKDNQWTWIPTGSGYVVELCKQPSGSPCIGVDTQEGYKSECKQMYIWTETSVIEPGSSSLSVKTIKIPSSCQCQGECTV